MTDNSPSTDDKTTPDSSDERTSSNGVFFAVIALIVIGTAGWYAMTLIGSEPIGVERAKELAEDFERECYLDLQDQERCRDLIGTHHRDCLLDNLERVGDGEGDDGSDIRHNREGYLECMRQNTGVGKGSGETEPSSDSDGSGS